MSTLGRKVFKSIVMSEIIIPESRKLDLLMKMF